MQRSSGRISIAPGDEVETKTYVLNNFNCIVFPFSVTIASGLIMIELRISIIVRINSWIYFHTRVLPFADKKGL